MNKEINDFLVNNFHDDICEKCAMYHDCNFNTNQFNLCEGMFCEETNERYLEDNMYEVLELSCNKNEQLQQENKQLKQQLKDKDDKISKIKDYCLIEREDVNGGKCDDILKILERNKEN